MKVVRTDNAPAAIGPYSQGIVVNGMLFASGQIALDPASGEMVGTYDPGTDRTGNEERDRPFGSCRNRSESRGENDLLLG